LTWAKAIELTLAAFCTMPVMSCSVSSSILTVLKSVDPESQQPEWWHRERWVMSVSNVGEYNHFC
jgi:hypothetical protein